MYIKRVFPILITFLIILFGCNGDKKNVDLSGVNIEDVKVERFERELFKTDLQQIEEKLPSIRDSYWPFFQNVTFDSTYYRQIRYFVNDAAMQRIYQETVKRFPDLTHLEEELTDLLKHYLYYFPDEPQPQVYSYLSELNFEFPVKRIDSALIISLDMYLGRDFGAYNSLGIPQYKSRYYIPESIPVDCANELIYQFVKVKRLDRNLLDEIVDRGKVMYAISSLLPEVEDSLIIKYTDEQIKWCENYEAHIWNHLVSEGLLFSTDNTLINTYINEGPFTTAFSKSSPARIGWWTGWQIVKTYMKKHPEIEMKTLLRDPDSQKILSESAYKPK